MIIPGGGAGKALLSGVPTIVPAVEGHLHGFLRVARGASAPPGAVSAGRAVRWVGS